MQVAPKSGKAMGSICQEGRTPRMFGAFFGLVF